MQLNLSPWNGLVEEAMDALEAKLWQTTGAGQYRFDAAWAFQIGWTSQRNVKMKGFQNPHQIQVEKHFYRKGINRKNPFDKKETKMWKAELFCLAFELFALLIPHFVYKQFVVHFGKMTDNSHVVPRHTDDQDISHQYAIHFGDWRGAELVMYDTANNSPSSDDVVLMRASERRRLVKFEGRLSHEVVKKNYKGTRFSVVCFQHWHEDKDESDPLCRDPHFVY